MLIVRMVQHGNLPIIACQSKCQNTHHYQKSPLLRVLVSLPPPPSDVITCLRGPPPRSRFPSSPGGTLHGGGWYLRRVCGLMLASAACVAIELRAKTSRGSDIGAFQKLLAGGQAPSQIASASRISPCCLPGSPGHRGRVRLLKPSKVQQVRYLAPPHAHQYHAPSINPPPAYIRL